MGIGEYGGDWRVGRLRTVGGVHDVVDVVYSETPVFLRFACDSAEQIFSFTAGLVSASSGR